MNHTRSEIKRFEEAIATAKAAGPGKNDPVIHQAMIEGMQSQLDELLDLAQRDADAFAFYDKPENREPAPGSPRRRAK